MAIRFYCRDGSFASARDGLMFRYPISESRPGTAREPELANGQAQVRAIFASRPDSWWVGQPDIAREINDALARDIDERAS